MPVITLLTDFGLSDTFVGVMKGVIWSICPEASIADLTHEIHPQNVLEGAFAIAEAAPYYPEGSIHVCVVDPGVGTSRRPMAALIDKQYFVGPDNGLFTLLIERAQEAAFVHLDRPRFWMPQVSNSFHGRDIFAPVAAHIANDIPLDELGTPFNDPIKIEIPQPRQTQRGWEGQVMRIDHFGNLITNLSSAQLPQGGRVNIHVGKENITDLVTSFGDRAPGSLIAMIGSEGFLEVAEVNGSAAARLRVAPGAAVQLINDLL